jgi:predicted TIM-barrel fold metal-dependent hydrolase
MQKADNIFIETHSLIACGALELIVKEIGPDRVIFGSGCPAASLAGALRQIQFADLPDPDKQKILSDNIKRILPTQA